jgi:hypothetical protein
MELDWVTFLMLMDLTLKINNFQISAGYTLFGGQ